MKTGISVLAAVVASFLGAIASAAGTQRQTRSVAPFESIEVGNSIELQVRQGPTVVVEVESPDGPVSDIVTEVQGGTLRVHDDRSWFAFFSARDRHRHVVRVTLPRLVAVTASGGSDVTGDGTITGERLGLRVSGGGDLRLDVAVASLTVDTSGGADVWLTGTARDASLRSSGGSDLDASRLKVENAQLASSGGSDIWIGESGTLAANASGGSHILYDGEPRSLTVNTSGGAGVSRRSGKH